jgi:hypothetical protein
MIQSLLILINYCFVGIVPGLLLYKIIFKEKQSRFYEYLPVSVCFSLAILLIPTFLAYFLGLSLSFIIYFFLVSCFVIVVLFVFRYRKNISTNGFIGLFKSGNPKLNIYLKALLIICLIVLVRAILTPAYEVGDPVRHVSDIRKIIELPQIISGSSFIKGFYGINNYGYNVWHIALAMITKLSGADIVNTWRLSPIFVAILLLLAYFFFARELFNNEKIAIFATSVFFIWEGLLGYNPSMPMIDNFWLWAHSAVPSFVAWGIIMFSVLALAFRYIREGEKKYLYLVSILTLTGASVHFYYFILLMLLLFSVFVFGWIFRRQDKILLKRVFVILIFAAIPAIFYVFYIFRGLSPITNPLFLTTLISGNQPVKMVFGFPVVDPFKVVFFGFIHWVSFLLVPLLVFLVSKKRYALYLFAFFIGPTLIIFNPPLLKILQKFNPALERAWRLNEAIPFTQVFGLFLFLLWEKTGGYIRNFISKQNKKKIVLAGLMLAIIILTLLSKSIIILYLGGRTGHVDEENYIWSKDFKETVKQNVPAGDVILMDNYTSSFWTRYYANYVVSVNWGMDNHIPPQFDQTERYNDAEKYMQQKNLDKWSFDFMNKYDVEYVLVNKNVTNNDYEIAPQLPDPFNNPYPQKTYYPEKDFVKYPDKFSLIYNSKDISLYRYNK